MEYRAGSGRKEERQGVDCGVEGRGWEKGRGVGSGLWSRGQRLGVEQELDRDWTV